MSDTGSNYRTSTSFTTMPPVLTESQKGSVEDIQISLAPYIQSYLSQTGRRHSCCSVMLPVAFERAAPRSWFDPRFDSPVLEGQYQASVFPQLRLKFRFALFYILLCSLVWLLYFLLDGGPTSFTLLTVAIGVIFLFALAGLWLTGTDLYRAHTNLISSFCAVLLCMFSLFLLLLTREALSPLGHFSICIEIVMLIYTIIPLPLWLCCTITMTYSVCFEVLSFLHQTHYDYNSRPNGSPLVAAGHTVARLLVVADEAGEAQPGAADPSGATDTFVYKIMLIRVLIQLCVHLIGVQILIMTVVRMRGTFMKVGQNLLVRRQLEMEKQLKEKMIHSMMPPKVADLLLKESGSVPKGTSFDQPYTTAAAAAAAAARRTTPSDLKSLFRPFHMNRMENVSILFADIVGFTRMSSTKTAEQLVEILNDLFERFDDLCLMNGCEKISTLGDCYYCVSGCPEPRPDHAICCVEMGLGMIESIRVFDAQRNEGIKMRVGVHTGTVLCGIVGTKRVKFDVWSNDVTLANRMESSGKPDQVHVSEETCGFLGDSYFIEEGEEVDSHRTFFVLGKKADLIGSVTEGLSSIGLPTDMNLLAASPLDEPPYPSSEEHPDSSCLSRSATNLSAIHPVVPPASPAGPVFFSSLHVSPVSTPRPRIASLSKMTKFLRSAVKGDGARLLAGQARGNSLGGGGGGEGEGSGGAAGAVAKPTIIISNKSISNGFESDDEIVDEMGGEADPAKQRLHAAGPSARSPASPRQSVASVDGGSGSCVCHQPQPGPASTTLTMLCERGRKGGDGGTVGASATDRFHQWRVGRLLKRPDANGSSPDAPEGGRICDSSKSCDEDVPCIEQCGCDGEGGAGGNQNGANGCYQHVPIVIVTPRPSCYTLDVSNGGASAAAGATSGAAGTNGHATCSSGSIGRAARASQGQELAHASQSSMFDEIIDVRSYISQSRSDISPFARTGSYRSQQADRSSIIHELAASSAGGGFGRPRSSTITNAPHSHACPADQQHVRHGSVVVCPSARLLGADGASLSPSATSRKDSGIRSNSRRSSIQQQLMLMSQTVALSVHRVSGYFTSSQSSLSGAMVTSATAATAAAMGTDCLGLGELPPGASGTGAGKLKPNGHVHGGMGGKCGPCGVKEPHPDPLAACLQQLRKQSDLQLIRCVRDNARSQRSYLVKPPLLPLSLRFKSRPMEREFRTKAHRFAGDAAELEDGGPPTLATPKYNTYIDLLVSFVVYLATSTSLFLLSPSVYLESYKVWVCIFVFFSTVQLFALFICTKQVCRRTRSAKPSVRRVRPLASRSCYDCLLQLASAWYPWHLCGGILMSLPVVSILSNFAMMDVTKFRVFEFHYGFLMYICIVHFCNFTQLNWWMRNCMALVTSATFVGIAVGHMVELQALEVATAALELANATTGPLLTAAAGGMSDAAATATSATGSKMLHRAQFDWFNNYRVEIYVDLFLLLVLVWFLNREFEIGYRLSFHGSAVANQDKIRVQNMKNQADMLLHNIIPKHVAEQLKNTAKYSENHHNIGIIFASIVNFNEMYDESYLGGKEYLRVLNELIGDFDELLARPEFRCVEKIKTIGSTFMAASGLDPSSRGENYEHLYTLLDFALAMQQVVESFNRDLLEFNLIMRVGYNFGDVTAGVIGTSKLYYDIWGDAVNVASRMDSTGVAGRIQVGSDCVPVLGERYDFERRGSVYVKGKDHMEVYLLVSKKPDLLGPPELDIDPV
uniref:adenylate cyclase n=1 Tax=Anopheles atroparvus TaxID=41427 RepID=A0AAG5DJW5_ANOAO